MKTSYSIVLLPGDGIGPEVTAGARLVLESVASRFKLAFDFSEFDFGGIAIDRWGTPLPEATLSACMSAQGVLTSALSKTMKMTNLRFLNLSGKSMCTCTSMDRLQM